MTTISSYTQLGGRHAETATITNTLNALGVKAPHSGLPFTEAMLLGLGGGLGAGYILWEFRASQTKVLVFGFQHKWNYTNQYIDTMLKRIHFQPVYVEGGAKAGQKALETAIAENRPATLWVDRYHLPYHGLEAALDGCYGHLINVFGIDGDTALVDDQSVKPFRVPMAALTAARNRISSYKNRMLTLEPAKGRRPAFEKSLKAGIQDTINTLSDDSESFSLPVLKKWSRLMTDSRNAKGWPKVFSEGKGIYSALSSVYENIELYNTGGGGLRDLYADFLTEAAPVLKQPLLLDAAARYRDLAAQWTRFAFDALDANASLRETRDLLSKRHALLREKGQLALPEVAQIDERLALFRKSYAERSPLDGDPMPFFSYLSDALAKLYSAENTALDWLKRAHTS